MDQEISPIPMDDRFAVFGTLFLLSNKLELVGNAFLEELTTKQWCFMAVLTTFFASPPTVSELAERLGTSHQNVKQVALRLEKKGFLRIEKDRQDSRSLRLCPTERIEAYAARREAQNNDFIERLFQEFDKETLHALRRSLDRLYRSLGELKKEIVL